MIEHKLTEEPQRSASPEDLTKSELTHDIQLQALFTQIVIMMTRFEEVNVKGVERSSDLQVTVSEEFIRTRLIWCLLSPHSLKKSRLNRHL